MMKKLLKRLRLTGKGRIACCCWIDNTGTSKLNNLFFFQNDETFVQLGELYELDRIIYASIGFNYSLTHTSTHNTLM